MKELVFEVNQETVGGFVAECLSESIFTQADTWEELRRNAKEAVRGFYFDQPQQDLVLRLHLVRDEVLALPGWEKHTTIEELDRVTNADGD